MNSIFRTCIAIILAVLFVEQSFGADDSTAKFAYKLSKRSDGQIRVKEVSVAGHSLGCTAFFPSRAPFIVTGFFSGDIYASINESKLGISIRQKETKARITIAGRDHNSDIEFNGEIVIIMIGNIKRDNLPATAPVLVNGRDLSEFGFAQLFEKDQACMSDIRRGSGH